MTQPARSSVTDQASAFEIKGTQMTQTQAAVTRGRDAPFSIEPVTIDTPRPDEVLVRMVAAGLCHTDLSVRSGRTPLPLPAVLGHEGAGIVERVGSDVVRVREGDHVLLTFNSCGSCSACHRDNPASCDDWASRNLLSGRRTDGSSTMRWEGNPVSASFFGQSAFSRRALVHERSVVRVDDDVPLEILAPLGCAIQTGMGTIKNVLRPARDSTLVIFGAGAVGLAAVMGAKIAGVERVVVVDRIASRLEIAKSLGATEIVDTRAGAGDDVLMSLTGGRGFDYSVEATGNVEILEQSFKCLASGGTCAVVGAPATGTTLSVDVKYLMRGRRLVGVTEGASNPSEFIPEMVQLYRDGNLPIEELIEFYKFEDIEIAATDALSGATIKPVLLFEPTTVRAHDVA